MSATSRIYTGSSTASARERELCAERRWEEAGRFVAEIMRRLPEWLRLRPEMEPRYQRPVFEEYGSASTTSYSGTTTASARERELAEERRWEEAGHLVADIARGLPYWFRLPPDVEQHFQLACIEQLRGVRAMIDHQIAEVERRSRRRTGTKIYVE